MKGTRRVRTFILDCIIDFDYNMLRSKSKVKDKVNLVLMHQMKNVEYYLGYYTYITTIAKKYVTLTFALDFDICCMLLLIESRIRNMVSVFDVCHTIFS